MIHAESTLKQMVACFFGINGHVVTTPLENRKTVNWELEMTISFPEISEEIRKNNRQSSFILLHDNASCQTSVETTRFLEGQKIELADHPPYSSDLAPKDFYLFPSVKNKLMRLKCTFWRYHNQNGKSAKTMVSAYAKVHRSSRRIF
ncbi:Mariner Mos1 transposase [Eumeta japonica]|uniref:Mariner Mos1 transposase n=1 Tax=Eumeta variegata TaxID=151549 RepID=A0A4C1VTN5_EUMVA|nr:Mariner Mos1 transposase [Eumeta japonica]